MSSPSRGARRTPLRAWRGSSWWGFAGALAIAAGSAAAVPEARAGDDDWSMSRKSSDPTLVGQRMAKLRRSPFDARQFRALTKAIGLQGLDKRVQNGLKRAPGNTALSIIAARIELEQGKPAAAAARLGAIQSKAGKWKGRIFALRVDALRRAGQHAKAARLLEAAVDRESSVAGKKALLRSAYEAADRARATEEALRLAERLVELDPKDIEATLRLARAARSAGQPKRADAAYAKAVSNARPRARDELIAERATARLDADNPSGASELLWDLVQDPRRGGASSRGVWFERLSEAHRRDRSLDVLLPRLAGWLKKHPSDAAGWRTLAQTQDAAGVDSIEAWNRALKLAPGDAPTHQSLIDALEASGDTAKTVGEFRKLLARSPQEVQYGLDLANRLASSGERELAMEIAAEIEQKAGRRAHSLLLLLDFYNLNDESELALGVAESLVKVAGRKPEARIALGEQLYQMGRVPEAMRQWAMLPKLIRPAHRGWARHAQVLSEHSRTSEAVASLKKALKLAPNDPGYLRLRAVLAESQRRPTQALVLWEDVRENATADEHKLLRDEARTRVVELLVGGSIPKRRLKLERAEREAKELLDSTDPRRDRVEAGRFLAELYTRQENYAAAVAVQHRLLELSPDSPDRLEELAAAQRRAGQVQSALGTLEELLVAEPGRKADVLAEMSELAFEAGDEDRALKTATRAAEADSSQVDALIRLGQLHERRGDIEAAAKSYKKALETAPNDARGRLRLAELELTRGNVDKSTEIFRDLLDQGGPPELLREAGRRALDLAEASDEAMQLVELAVRRTTRRPEADEPREFLLEAMGRVTVVQLQRWIKKGSDSASDKRRAELRRPLVVALTRGSIGARLRAAEHLGRLKLPDTAVPLAKMGASLSAPRDSTATVRAAFERARVTAIRAAGELGDPKAVPLFAGILKDSSQSMLARHAAGWALMRAGTKDASEALSPFISVGGDPEMAALGCAALVDRPRSEVSAAIGTRVAEVARKSRHAHTRHVCALAEAALTPDRSVKRLYTQLMSSDPVPSAIAAWRMGRVATADGATVETLLRRFIGPAGLPRDAAGAALSRLLTKRKQADDAPPLPRPRSRNWAQSIERWLQDRIAPSYAPIDAEALSGYDAALRRAIAAAQAGTRPERVAVDRVMGSCDERTASGSPTAHRSAKRGPGELGLCLAPLAETTVLLPGTAD